MKTAINIEADQICQALYREIVSADRWDSVLLAGKAIITVRRLEKECTTQQREAIATSSISADVTKKLAEEGTLSGYIPAAENPKITSSLEG